MKQSSLNAPLGGGGVISRLPIGLKIASLPVLVLTASASFGWQGQSAAQRPKTLSADAMAVFIDMPYPKPPQTPAHFRWPMKFEITVDKKGRVSRARNIEHQRDVRPFVEAVRRARFKPAVSNGVPYETTFVFTIDQPDMHARLPSDGKR